MATDSAQGEPPCHLPSAPGARPSPLPPPCSRLPCCLSPSWPQARPGPRPPTCPSRKLPVPRPPLHCAQGSFSGALRPCPEPSPAFRGRAPHSFTHREAARRARTRCGGLRGLTGKLPAGPPTDLGGRLLLGPPPGLYAEGRALLGAQAFPRGLGIPQPPLPLVVDALTGTATAAGGGHSCGRAVWGPPACRAPPAPREPAPAQTRVGLGTPGWPCVVRQRLGQRT